MGGYMGNKLDYRFVEGYRLDQQQIASIENDTQNTLVIAGAGTGKTTTIIGKIKWILNKWQLEEKNTPPPKILAVSFTHASRVELEERILTEILQDDLVFKIYHPRDFIQVETFHSLALKIIKDRLLGRRLEESGFKSFLKLSHPDLPEEKIDNIDHLYSLVRNYHVNFTEIREELRRKFRHFWQKEDLKQKLTQLEELEILANQYEEHLKKNHSIDFAGLLEEATSHTNSICTYDYVIIDEYQDISPLEYSLIRSLRRLRPFKLFCVGDDWQTIYQFAGSEISLILNFEKCWGVTMIFKIERTYRFPEKLAKLSGGFIMQNTAQLMKQIRGKRLDEDDQIVEINGPSERTDLNSLYFFFLNMPEHASVFLIGRYNFDIKKISRCEFLSFEISEEKILISMHERPDLRISFLSAHKSKGLQADYVFIINCRDTILGFPSKVEEDGLAGFVRELAILKLSSNKGTGGRFQFLRDFLWKRKPSDSDFAFSEERRLFYVAMTRARKKVLFLTVKDKESPFILELRENSDLKTYFLD